MEKQPGKKHKQELKEKAFALLVCNNASYSPDLRNCC